MKRSDFWSFISAIGVLVVMLALLVTSAPPANAEQEHLKVGTSPNGPWSDTLAPPLWTDDGPFVPFDAVPDTFYILNDSNQPARATLSVLGLIESEDEHWRNALTFTAEFAGADPIEIAPYVGPGTKCKTYVESPTILPRGTQAVKVTMNVADLDGLDGQNATADVDFLLTLGQTTKKGKVDLCTKQTPNGPKCDVPNGAVVVAAVGRPCVEVRGAAATSQRSPGTPMSAERGATTVLGWSALGVLLAGLLLAARQRRRRA